MATIYFSVKALRRRLVAYSTQVFIRTSIGHCWLHGYRFQSSTHFVHDRASSRPVVADAIYMLQERFIETISGAVIY